jgi:hypothetical protein
MSLCLEQHYGLIATPIGSIDRWIEVVEPSLTALLA